MNIRKKILPVIGLLSAYAHLIKPRLLSASAASKGGKSLVLHLCARSRFLIPMIVFTAFYIFDAQMQIGLTVSLTLNNNVRILFGPDGAQPGADPEDDGGAGDDDDSYATDSFTDDDSFGSDDSRDIELDDIEAALLDFMNERTDLSAIEDESDVQ